MNEIVNKFLLTGDKFMPEMHLKQPGFTYSACGPFIKNKEIIQTFMQPGNTRYVYKNDLDKTCFRHDMPYGKYKDLTQRTESDKVLRDEVFKIASNPKYNGYERVLASMVYKFFDKKSKDSGMKSMSKQQLPDELYKVRPEILNINSNKPSFYPYSILVNKCSGSCNNINDPYAKLCIFGVVKNMNTKVINLMPRTIETRYIDWHETCKCKCILDASVSNNKQRWNKDKCRCESNELIEKDRCDKGFIWNSSICECECDKSCDVGEYLDYENCKCRKKLTDKLAEECSEDIDGNEMIHNATLNDYGRVCKSCTIYIALLVIFFIIIIRISSAFFYFHWYLKRSNTNTIINTNIEAVIY